MSGMHMIRIKGEFRSMSRRPSSPAPKPGTSGSPATRTAQRAEPCGLISPDGAFITDVLGPSIVASVGFGLCLGPVVSIATAGVAPHETGTASGLLNSSRQIGASLGLAVLGAAAQHRTGQTATPSALTDGYAFGLTLGAALLATAVLIALTVLPRTGSPSRAEQADDRDALLARD
jgi:hypothetical protein